MQIIFANTLFRVVCFHTSEVQLLTAGTDRKIGYWEMYDGSQIRELEASRSGSINGMDLTKDGTIFVTGGDDKIVKVSQSHLRFLFNYSTSRFWIIKVLLKLSE